MCHCGSRVIVIVPSYHRAFVDSKFFPVGVTWVQKIFSWVFFEFKGFPLSISWVQNVFSWVFFGSKVISHGYFVVPKFFLVDISWVTREHMSKE